MNNYKSIFREEIEIHMKSRIEELGWESYRHYKHVVESFDDYLYRSRITEENIGQKTIEGWIDEISQGISSNTVAQYIHYIRQLMNYLTVCGHKCYIPQNIKNKDTYVPYLYTDDEIRKIFSSADEYNAPKATYVNRELPMLLRLLYCCGLRVGEALRIKREDIDFDRNLLILKVTKKYKQRIVPFGSELSEMLYRYCLAMNVLYKPESFIFPGRDESHTLSDGIVREHFKIILKNAGISRNGYKAGERGPCIHCFRHSFAVRSFHLIDDLGIRTTEAVPFLSTYLGHDSLYETEKYLKYSGDFFDDSLERFDAFTEGIFPEVEFDV